MLLSFFMQQLVVTWSLSNQLSKEIKKITAQSLVQ